MTQKGDSTALPRPASRRKKAGLHLIRRGSIYYFRRRSPTVLVRIGAPPFTCFSLRTHFPTEAMKHPAALFTALEEVERKMIDERQTSALSPQEIKKILDEVVRSELGRIIDSLDVQQPRSTGIVEARIASYATIGNALSKADEADDAKIVAMRARSDISDLEKRSQLKTLLVPGQTPANIQHHLNRFRRIFKAAAKHLG